MIVAELCLTEGGFGDRGTIHVVRFDDVAKATSEYERVADLMNRRADRANDVPKMLEVIGESNKVTLPLDHLRAVALHDFAVANAQLAGVRDTFPNVFKL